MAKTIAVDIDDVLAATAGEWVAFSNRRWGTNLTVEDYHEDWARIWGLDNASIEERASMLHASGIFGAMPVHDQAQTVLRQLSRRYKLVVATSRVMKVHKDTLRWLDQHFKGVFSGVHMSGIFDKDLSDDALSMTKAQLIREIGADYLIDDQLKHCFAVAEAGIEAVLFGEYPWNKAAVLPPGVRRCKDWAGVWEFFNERG